ncbi:hypothetical protein [Polluticoccus soli]|uniref:hypothetical protein n=1 Tax=Polluticoccus soli TaxID=3034150 RepID=UPI0023E1287B|nr:hypothetical protein [Flavipsychrobacter sp. JY13-12]
MQNKRSLVVFIMTAIIFALAPNNALSFDRYSSTIGETPRFSLHLTSPLGAMTKGGLKLEGITASGVAVLGFYTRYWGIFPGNQFGVEGAGILSMKKATIQIFFYTVRYLPAIPT